MIPGQETSDWSQNIGKLTEIRFATQPSSSFIGPLGGSLRVESDIDEGDDLHSVPRSSDSEFTGTTTISSFGMGEEDKSRMISKVNFYRAPLV